MSVLDRLRVNESELVTEIESSTIFEPLKTLLNFITIEDFHNEDDLLKNSLQGISRYYYVKNRERILQSLSRPAYWGKILQFQGLLPSSLKDTGATIETVADELLKVGPQKLGVLDLSRGCLTSTDLTQIANLSKLVEQVVVLDLSFNSFFAYGQDQTAFNLALENLASAWAGKVEFILVFGSCYWGMTPPPPFIYRCPDAVSDLPHMSRNHHISYYYQANQ